LPTIQYDLDSNRAKDNSNTYASNYSVSWELDLWQRIEDSVHRDEMIISQTQISYQATRDAIAANIMRNWLEITLQQLADIEEQRLLVLKNNEDIILKRYRTGLGQLEDLDSAISRIESIKGNLLQYHEALANARRNLQQVLGELSVDYHLPTIADFPDVIVNF